MSFGRITCAKTCVQAWVQDMCVKMCVDMCVDIVCRYCAQEWARQLCLSCWHAGFLAQGQQAKSRQGTSAWQKPPELDSSAWKGAARLVFAQHHRSFCL